MNINAEFKIDIKFTFNYLMIKLILHFLSNINNKLQMRCEFIEWFEFIAKQ